MSCSISYENINNVNEHGTAVDIMIMRYESSLQPGTHGSRGHVEAGDRWVTVPKIVEVGLGGRS